MQKGVFALVISVFVAPTGAFAQDSILNSCEDCAIVRVDVPPPVGVLRQAAAREGARSAIALSTASAQQPPQQRRRWVGRHPILAGTLTGAGLGFVAGAGMFAGDEGSFDPADNLSWWQGGFILAPVFAIPGAAAGAVVWLIRR